MELRLLIEVRTDDIESPFPLLLAMKFSSRVATRWANDEKSKGLLNMFNGEIIHTVFSADQLDLASL